MDSFALVHRRRDNLSPALRTLPSPDTSRCLPCEGARRHFFDNPALPSARPGREESADLRFLRLHCSRAPPAVASLTSTASQPTLSNYSRLAPDR